jgi:hypothetical protein
MRTLVSVLVGVALLAGTAAHAQGVNPAFELYGALGASCQGDVVVAAFDRESPAKDGGLYLKRDEQSRTPWSEFLVPEKPRFTWYCHPKSPFPWLEPGTYRVQQVREQCLEENPPEPRPWYAAGPQLCDAYHLYTERRGGWSVVRSECPEGTVFLRAYLGPQGRVRFNCYGRAEEAEDEMRRVPSVFAM